MIKDFKYYDEDKKIYEEEIMNFIPGKVIDFHVHLWKMEQIVKPVSADRKKKNSFYALDVINEFTYEDFLNYTSIIFPQTEYSGLFFGLPFKEVEINENNNMIEERVIDKKVNALFIPKPDDDYSYLENTIKRKNFIGFKPYPDLATGKEYLNYKDSVNIFDFLNEDVLKTADKFGLIIMLHIPKAKRLSDKENIRDIFNIAASYPNIKLCLAHAGRSFCLEAGTNSIIKKISSLKNLFLDISGIQNHEVLEMLLENFSSEKILFGSDFPILFLRGKHIFVNGKFYNFTARPFPWSISNAELNEKDITFMIYEEIREIKKAIQKKNRNSTIINNIFYKNAENMIVDIKESLRTF